MKLSYHWGLLPEAGPVGILVVDDDGFDYVPRRGEWRGLKFTKTLLRAVNGGAQPQAILSYFAEHGGPSRYGSLSFYQEVEAASRLDAIRERAVTDGWNMDWDAGVAATAPQTLMAPYIPSAPEMPELPRSAGISAGIGVSISVSAGIGTITGAGCCRAQTPNHPKPPNVSSVHVSFSSSLPPGELAVGDPTRPPLLRRWSSWSCSNGPLGSIPSSAPIAAAG